MASVSRTHFGTTSDCSSSLKRSKMQVGQVSRPVSGVSTFLFGPATLERSCGSDAPLCGRAEPFRMRLPRQGYALSALVIGPWLKIARRSLAREWRRLFGKAQPLPHEEAAEPRGWTIHSMNPGPMVGLWGGTNVETPGTGFSLSRFFSAA